MKKTVLLLVTLFVLMSISAQTAAFLGIAADVNSIADDDEKAAAEWFVNTYGGTYISTSTISSVADINSYDVIWIAVDREDGVPDAYDEIYAIDAILTEYYKAGGNLLLTIHATNLLTDFGRLSEWPDLTAAGTGGENPDVWQLSTSYGTWDPTKTVFDRSVDPLFEGLTTETVTRDNGNEYTVIPLIGSGWKEDHNCFWSMTLGDNPLNNDDETKLTTWESTYNVVSLGSWGQVQDYFGAAVARWNPQGDFQGTAITIGIGAYEWHINNDGTNPYQANIEKLTQNALNELSTPTGLTTQNISEYSISISNNRLYINNTKNVLSGTLYNVSGKVVKNSNSNEIENGIKISELNKGVYIMKFYGLNNLAISTQKFVIY